VLAPFQKMTVLAGRNNAGKSNALQAINRALLMASQNAIPNLSPDDRHDRDMPLRFGVLLRSVDPLDAPALSGHADPWSTHKTWLIQNWPQRGPYFEVPLRGNQSAEERFCQVVAANVEFQWSSFCETHYNISSPPAAGAVDHHIRSVIQPFRDLQPMYIDPHRKLNLAVREADAAGIAKMSQGDKFDGEFVTTLLNYYQSPSLEHEEEHQALFNKFMNFLRDVFEAPFASLRVPATRNDILLNLNGAKNRSIKDYGTGVRQIVLIAAACSFVSGRQILLEEPESNLHPSLVRKLIRYLMEQTDNQYFVATHSAAIIDTEGASVVHLALENGCTVATTVISQVTRRKTCSDLGYRASEFVQSNCILWVEGPSDRIYVRHWLRLVDPELAEGTHYSMMFFGGGLYENLTGHQADEDEAQVEDFISLTRMNQNSAFIADRDKDRADAPLDSAKTRVVESLQGRGWSWISGCREVENYVPLDTFAAVIADTHPRSDHVTPSNPQWDVVTKRRARRADATKDKDIDKVDAADRVVKRQAEQFKEDGVFPNNYDLLEKIQGLSDFIRSANGLTCLPWPT
jgi:energy-coupling factor transporter ATP-binding protein EcfA2